MVTLTYSMRWELFRVAYLLSILQLKMTTCFSLRPFCSLIASSKHPLWAPYQHNVISCSCSSAFISEGSYPIALAAENGMWKDPETLKVQLLRNMKGAMQKRDMAQLNAVRSIQTAIKQREVDERSSAIE
jgi:hypothetical protein